MPTLPQDHWSKFQPLPDLLSAGSAASPAREKIWTRFHPLLFSLRHLIIFSTKNISRFHIPQCKAREAILKTSVLSTGKLVKAKVPGKGGVGGGKAKDANIARSHPHPLAVAEQAQSCPPSPSIRVPALRDLGGLAWCTDEDSRHAPAWLTALWMSSCWF